MSLVFGEYGPTFSWLGRVAQAASRPFYVAYFKALGVHRAESRHARERLDSMRRKLDEGRPVYLLGISPAGHNAGAALVEVSRERGIHLVCSEEEERYRAVKNYPGFPEQGLETVKRRMADLGIKPEDIHACCGGWDYPTFLPVGLKSMWEHAPWSFALALQAASPKFNSRHVLEVAQAPRRLGRQLGLGRPLPIIALRHHDNHAYFSWAVSPFNQSSEPVMLSVIDGYGDDAAISLYVAEEGRVRMLRRNDSQSDSLGLLYGVISSTQGGWPPLSSEGRYMGAAAWGNNDRLTNPFYRRLRQIVYFGPEGQVHINRAMANWHAAGARRPYKRLLEDVLGPPIPDEKMWNPDAILRVEDVRHAEITQARVDKAAALQMVFEDALFHVVQHLIQETGSDKLVMSGGTALNCIANMRLMEHFDEPYYERYLKKKARLRLWVPPTPGDSGVAMGAAYHFALLGGARPGATLQHAFHCGLPPSLESIRAALAATPEVGFVELGDASRPDERLRIADFAAYVVARDGVLGLFQGPAEIGPRALGHRSILANPTNARALEQINRLVKFREAIRPLAPMATLEAATRFFELAPGAADAEYNAYNYMVLTTRARPEAYERIPAVVHRDGTSRVQIVRESVDPFAFAYLRAMGRHAGVEVSVNTSLNVGSPIVQTPLQALEALRKSRGMTGLLLIGSEGNAVLAWHDVVSPPKDGGKMLRSCLDEWRAKVAAEPGRAPEGGGK